MTERWKTITVVTVAALALGGVFAVGFDLPKWFPFNSGDALKDWQEKVFRGRVLYTVEDGGKEGGYLAAVSQEACSGLFYKVKFDAEELPLISWDWKVSRFPEKKGAKTDEEGWLEKDDFAARVYVIFSGWNFLATKSLEYIWDETLPAGTVMSSPSIDNIKLIVVESGRKNLNNWVAVERNIFEDYKKAFGEKPPREVSAVALMTDSDNTLSTAEAYYRNMRVGYKR